MAFTPEQAAEIKKQLLAQVENLPNENKDQIKKQIEGFNEEQLEEFLKQNNIQTGQSKSQTSSDPNQQSKPVFQAIVDNEIPNHKLAENKKAIAILELNPQSKGHSLIIPKEKTTVEKIPNQAFSLAQKISKKIKTKLKPEDVKIETFSFQDYPAINVIPIYKDTPLKKEKASDEQLDKLKNQLLIQPVVKKPRIKKLKNLPELKFRIP